MLNIDSRLNNANVESTVVVVSWLLAPLLRGNRPDLFAPGSDVEEHGRSKVGACSIDFLANTRAWSADFGATFKTDRRCTPPLPEATAQ